MFLLNLAWTLFNVCNGTDNLAMRFVNPDAEAVECVKKMVDMRKYAVDNNMV